MACIVHSLRFFCYTLFDLALHIASSIDGTYIRASPLSSSSIVIVKHWRLTTQSQSIVISIVMVDHPRRSFVLIVDCHLSICKHSDLTFSHRSKSPKPTVSSHHDVFRSKHTLPYHPESPLCWGASILRHVCRRAAYWISNTTWLAAASRLIVYCPCGLSLWFIVKFATQKRHFLVKVIPHEKRCASAAVQLPLRLLTAYEYTHLHTVWLEFVSIVCVV